VCQYMAMQWELTKDLLFKYFGAYPFYILLLLQHFIINSYTYAFCTVKLYTNKSSCLSLISIKFRSLNNTVSQVRAYERIDEIFSFIKNNMVMLILGLRNVYFLKPPLNKVHQGGSFSLLKWCIDNKKDSKLTN